MAKKETKIEEAETERKGWEEKKAEKLEELKQNI